MLRSLRRSLVRALVIVKTPSGGDLGRKELFVRQYAVNCQNGFERALKCWKGTISATK